MREMGVSAPLEPSSVGDIPKAHLSSLEKRSARAMAVEADQSEARKLPKKLQKEPISSKTRSAFKAQWAWLCNLCILWLESR